MPIAANRTCGSCTLCCKLLEAHEIERPANEGCTQCSTKAGCAIYGSRPHACIDFECLLLRGVGPDELRPDRSKVVMVDRMETSFVVCGDQRIMIKGKVP